MPLPPGGPYLLALPALLSSHPAVFAGFVALLQMVSLSVMGRATAQKFGGAAGLWALALAATSPYLVHTSRILYPFALLPVFGAYLYKWLLEDEPRWGSLAALAAAGALIQPLFIVPVLVAVAVLRFGGQSPVRALARETSRSLQTSSHPGGVGSQGLTGTAPLAAGLVLAGLWLPYLIDLAGEGGGALRPGIGEMGRLVTAETGRVFGWDAIRNAGGWLTVADVPHLVGDVGAVFGRGAWLVPALGLAGMALLLYGMVRMWRNRRQDAFSHRVALWSAGTLGLLWLLPIGKMAPYLTVLYPAPFVLAGAALVSRAEGRATGKIVWAAAGTALIVANLWVLGTGARWLSSHEGFPGGYGVALSAQMRAAEAIAGEAGGRPVSVTTNEPIPIHLVGLAYLLNRRGVKMTAVGTDGAVPFYVERGGAKGPFAVYRLRS